MQRVVAFAYTKPPAYPLLTEIRSQKKIRPFVGTSR